MNDFTLLLPEFLVTGLAFLVLTADFFLHSERKHLLAYMSVLGLGAVLAFSLVYLWDPDDSLYEGVILVDGYALFFKAFFLVLGGVVVLTSLDYVRRHLDYPGEYYGILLFTVVAMMLLAASGELLTAYISLELLSFGLYVLVSYDRYNPKSNEGGTKYILLGAFSSALLLYGISQIYGLLGTTRFDEIGQALAATSGLSPGVLVGLVLIIAGLGFKVAAVPFHMWAPDAYEGAPIPVTAYLAVGSKGGRLRPRFETVHRGADAGRGRLADRTGHLGRADHGHRQPPGPGATQHQETAGLLQHRPRGVPPHGHRGPCRGGARRQSIGGVLPPGVQRRHASPRGIRHHQHGGVLVGERHLQYHGQRRDSRPGRCGAALTYGGRCPNSLPVLTCGFAHIRGVHQQILPVQQPRRLRGCSGWRDWQHSPA